jgi:hypothetical protein
VNDRVAFPEQHEGSGTSGLGRELAGEPALARAGFSAQQHDASALSLGAGQQRPEHPKLGRSPDERERR